MQCAWNAFLSILPAGMQKTVDLQGRETLQELRLRLNRPAEMVLQHENRQLSHTITTDDLNFVINTASRYSPWTAYSVAQGFLTAPGGHRIGICGEAVVKNGEMTGFRNYRSLNIRIARDFSGVAAKLAHLGGNVLLLGPPGSGKTTLLRDLIRLRSEAENVSVVDERGELFPKDFSIGKRTDVVLGCSKSDGVFLMLRSMGPDTIAVDEITAEADCEALLQAGRCGVKLIATVHAAGREDLLYRPIYRSIVQSKLFDHLVVLRKDKSFTVERMPL